FASWLVSPAPAVSSTGDAPAGCCTLAFRVLTAGIFGRWDANSENFRGIFSGIRYRFFAINAGLRDTRTIRISFFGGTVRARLFSPSPSIWINFSWEAN